MTHSWAAGWHPHCHILLFVGQADVAVRERGSVLRTAPRDPPPLVQAHGQVSSAARCRRSSASGSIQSRPDDAAGSGQYLTKVGYEMAMVDTKVGRGDGHRTPFAIAHDATETGDKADIDLFREWVKGVASESGRSPGRRACGKRSTSAPTGPTRSWPPKTPDGEIGRRSRPGSVATDHRPARRCPGRLPRLLRNRRQPRRHHSGCQLSSWPRPGGRRHRDRSRTVDRARPSTTPSKTGVIPC